jgi:hypothetical protein
MKNLNNEIDYLKKEVNSKNNSIKYRDKQLKDRDLKITHLSIEIRDLMLKLELETNLKNEIMQGFINVKNKLKEEQYLNGKNDIDREYLTRDFFKKVS